MSLFSAEELADLRGEVTGEYAESGELPDTVLIRRKSGLIPDGAGGWKPVSGDGWADIATVAGRLSVSRVSPRERGLGEQVNAAFGYDVFIAHGSAAVKTEDKLVINSRTFEVKGIGKAEEWHILDRLYVVELQK